MKRNILTVFFLVLCLLIYNHGFAQKKKARPRGGEVIHMVDGRSVRGIISKFEGQTIYVATTQRGRTLIQRGQRGRGVVLINVTNVSSIEWFGRNDKLKKRVQEAIIMYQTDESLYEKLSLIFELEGNAWAFSYGNYSEKDKTLTYRIGPSYILKRERAKDGYYFSGRGFIDFDSENDDEYSLSITGVKDFEEAKQQNTTGTGQNQEQYMGTVSSYTDYSIGGYKYYLHGTPYFAFGEAQISYDRRKAKRDVYGNDVPDMRLFFGAGWGRVFNIAESTRSKTVESFLKDEGIISKPFSRTMQKEIEILFRQTDNPSLQTREIFKLLKRRRYIKAEPTFDQSLDVLQMIEDSFAYRLEGIEFKGGLLSHVMHQSDEEYTMEKEEKIDPTLDIAGYINYYKPISKPLQFTQEAMLLQHVSPSPKQTVLVSNSELDYKYSSELILTGYNLFFGIVEDFKIGDSLIAMDEIGSRATYYIAEKVTVKIKAYCQFLIAKQEVDDFKYRNAGIEVSSEYIF